MEKMRNVLDHTLEILSGVSFLAMVVLTCGRYLPGIF